MHIQDKPPEHSKNKKKPLQNLQKKRLTNYSRGNYLDTANFLYVTLDLPRSNEMPLAGIEPHIFCLLVRRVNHYTTRTNHAGNAAS